MMLTPTRIEIDHRTIKLIVGCIALFLASVTSFLSQNSIESISASYHVGGWARDVFVGCLFAITAFLLAYNGYSTREMLLSKVAAIAAFGVAMFPCGCKVYPEIVPGLHGIAAGVMFVVLAALCYTFRQRARAKGHREAMLRSHIYELCGLTIIATIVVLGGDNLLGGPIAARVPRLTFYGERTGLIAFAVAWLTASRVLPGVSSGAERFAPWSEKTSD